MGVSQSTFAAERMAIIAIRKLHPTLGAFKLAKRIRAVRTGQIIASKEETKLVDTVGYRPYYSVLSVIRRYDRRGYYASYGQGLAQSTSGPLALA